MNETPKTIWLVEGDEDSWLWIGDPGPLDPSDAVEYVRIDEDVFSSYAAWRISYQSSEQAAKSAYTEMVRLLMLSKKLTEEVAEKEDSTYRIDLDESELEHSREFVTELVEALQAIYALNGEDKRIADICNPLIERSRLRT